MSTNNAVNNLPQGRNNAYVSVSLTPENVLTNVTGDGTYYTLVFPNVYFNSYSSYNPANGLFTCNTKGYYQVQMNLNCMYNNTSVFSLIGLIHVRSQGTNYTFGSSSGQFQTTTFTQQPFTLTSISPPLLMLPEADTIYFQILGNSNDEDYKTASISASQNLFNVFYVTCIIEILRLGK